MSDNVVFMKITNPAGKTTSRGFEIDRDGIVRNPTNHDPMFFAGRESDPIRVRPRTSVEIPNSSDQFAVQQFLAGNCKSIRAGVDLFYAKRAEEKKAEQKTENEFLRSKGYRWEKRRSLPLRARRDGRPLAPPQPRRRNRRGLQGRRF